MQPLRKPFATTAARTDESRRAGSSPSLRSFNQGSLLTVALESPRSNSPCPHAPKKIDTTIVNHSAASSPTTTTTTSTPSPTESTSFFRSHGEPGDEDYDQFTKGTRLKIVAIVTFAASVCLLAKSMVVASQEYLTTGDAMNTGFTTTMIPMGLSPTLWVPAGHYFGRRPVILYSIILFTVLTLITALTPEIAIFWSIRAILGWLSTGIIVLGAGIICDIHRPTERATPLSWFGGGLMFESAISPILKGLIVTYSAWRVIFWVQTVLGGLCGVCLLFLIPKTASGQEQNDFNSLSTGEQIIAILKALNPARTLERIFTLRVALAGFSTVALLWNVYGLPVPIRYVLNPRFGLNDPIPSGLLFLSLGAGYVTGSIAGGPWVDWMMRRWVRKRSGIRVPEDRLRAMVPWLGIVVPSCTLMYGWAVDLGMGGVAMPVVLLFLQSFACMFCFPAVDAYFFDAEGGHGFEVYGATMFLRLMGGVASSAAIIPIIDMIGVGWYNSINTVMFVISTLTLLISISLGEPDGESKMTWAGRFRRMIAM